MNSPDALVRLGATGKARWRERFSWRLIARRYEAILAGREFERGSSVDDFGLVTSRSNEKSV